MRLHSRLAATAAAGAVAVGTLTALAAPAHADVERHGSCRGATYELSVDKEAGGFEVSFDLDQAAAGSRWVVALRHDGKRYFHRTLTAYADDDNPAIGEFDVDRFRTDTSGADVFSVRFRQAGTTSYCSAKIRIS